MIIRPLESDAEKLAFHRLSSELFSSEPDHEAAAERSRRATESLPEFHPRQLRGAFRGTEFLGGYICWDRWLQVGNARVHTGCIGSVMTHPSYRRQGVATALMQDSFQFAEAEQHALLFLDGIPSFYHRYGYVDVADVTEHVIDRAAIPTESTREGYMRLATVDDAPALLDLYNRHYGSHVGSFTRSFDQQRGRLERSVASGNPPIVFADAAGALRGYLVLRRGAHVGHAVEVAADTAAAALALVRYHSQRVAELLEAPATLTWPLPPDASTVYLLSDNLVPLGMRQEGAPDVQRVVWSQTYRQPNTGWLARLVSLPRLIEQLQPAFQTRLANRRLAWQGAFALRAGGEVCAIDVQPDAVPQLSVLPSPVPLVDLAPSHLAQLTFGFRPISYLAELHGASVPAGLLPILDVLFPAGQPWVPGTDAF